VIEPRGNSNLHAIWGRISQKEQQRVAVGPGNTHFISIRQVSSDTATLQRGRWGTAAAAAPAADAAVYRQFDD